MTAGIETPLSLATSKETVNRAVAVMPSARRVAVTVTSSEPDRGALPRNLRFNCERTAALAFWEKVHSTGLPGWPISSIEFVQSLPGAAMTSDACMPNAGSAGMTSSAGSLTVSRIGGTTS